MSAFQEALDREIPRARFNGKIAPNLHGQRNATPLLASDNSSLNRIKHSPHQKISRGEFVFEDDNGKTRLIADSETARLLAESQSGRLAYNAEAGVWHAFQGTHWQSCHASIADEAITDDLFVGCEGAGFRATYLQSVITILKRGNLLPLPTVPGDSIPFRNGLLDLTSGSIKPIIPTTAATWCIPHNYRRDYECPAFMSWLDSATGHDEGKKMMLRAFIAAAVTGRADSSKIPVFERAGRDRKIDVHSTARTDHGPGQQ